MWYILLLAVMLHTRGIHNRVLKSFNAMKQRLRDDNKT